MSYAADDLTPLLARPTEQGGGLDFGQGVVLSWDTATGANSISYRGATLTNLPILNTGEATALRPGSVVGILRAGRSYFILGRITRPGDPDFASASLEFAVPGGNFAQNFAIGTTRTSKLTKTISVPPWADEALVLAGAVGSAHNTSGGLDGFLIRAVVTWAGGSAISHETPVWIVDGAIAALSAWESVIISNPGETITLDAEFVASPTAVAASANNTANIEASVVFRSVI